MLRGKKPKFISEFEVSSNASVSDISKPKVEKPVKFDQSIIPSYIEPTPDTSKPDIQPRGHQLKSKRRIVIGNVSRWIECDQREDLATHKVKLSTNSSLINLDFSTCT